MRRASHRDDNEPSIVKALRADGNVVTIVREGDGVADLLVWCWRLQRLRAIEIKLPLSMRARLKATLGLTDDQQEWWRANPEAVMAGDLVLVRSIEEALEAVGAYDGPLR